MSDELECGDGGGEGVVGLKPDLQDERLKLAAKAEEGMRALLERGAMDCLINVGVIKSATCFARVSDILLAKAYMEIKKSRGYVGLPYRDENGRPATVADLETFSRVFLGRSSRRCQELAANYHMLGEDLYEAAEAVGWRQRDYVAMRGLSEDQQQEVRDLLASDDKDRALEVMSDLVAKNAAKAQASEARAQALEAKYAERDEDYLVAVRRADEWRRKAEKILAERERASAVPRHEELKALGAQISLVARDLQYDVQRLGELSLRVQTVAPPEPGTPEADAFRREMTNMWLGFSLASELPELLYQILVEAKEAIEPFSIPFPELLEEVRAKQKAEAETRAGGHTLHVVK